MALTEYSFEDFARLRDRLAAMLIGVAEVFCELDVSERAGTLRGVHARLLEDRFKVVLLGEMKFGKSTLINALLGEEIVPTEFGVACTAIPISMRWAAQRRALCFRSSTDVPDEINIERGLAAFWDAVKIAPSVGSTGSADTERSRKRHPYTHAVFEAPLPLLKNGVELQDTPGTNENRDRTAATWESVDQSGAVVVVFSCQQVGRESDITALRGVELKGLDPRVVFVVWNYFDMCRKQKHGYERVRAEAYSMAERLGIPHDHICFVSASEGLEAKEKQDAELLEASGLPALERALGTFLMHEAAAAKLLGPLEHAKRAVNEALHDVLSRCVTVWSSPPQKSAKAAEEAEGLPKAAAQIRKGSAASMRKAGKDLKRDVREAARSLVDDLLDGVADVVNGIPLTSAEAVFKKDSAREQLRDGVQEWVKEQTAKWESKRLKPLLRECSVELRGEAASAAAELAGLHRRAVQLYECAKNAQNASLASQQHDEDDNPSTKHSAEKMSPDPTTFTDDWLSDMSLSTGVGAAAIVGTVGGWVTLILAAPLLPLVAIIAGLAVLARGASGATLLKVRTVETVMSQMRARSDDMVDALVDDIGQTVLETITAIEDHFETMDDSLQEQITRVLEQHAENERVASEHLRFASGLRDRLQGYADDLGALGREIDPLQSADRMAERIADQLRGRPGGTDSSSPSDHRTPPGQPIHLSDSELEIKLDKNALGRVSSVEQLLKSYGRWNAETRRSVMAAWSRLPQLSEQATVQVPVYRTVTATAVGCGNDHLPFPEDVNAWWKDQTLRTMMLDLYEAVTGERHPYEAHTTAEKQRSQIGLFMLAYGRARKAAMGSDGTLEQAAVSK